ncbi:MAG TPA: glycosyltransferase family 1 protein [Candidatus Acidoferrales bacterium]|nr:glycosyltransferase family 1 protein [Candidatus Acidoferrales bacterium]
MAVVALDARLTRQMSVGMKSYVRELVARVPRHAPGLEFLVFGNEPFEKLDANASFRPVGERVARNGGLGEQIAFPRLLERSGADLVHHMSVYAPRKARYPHVYTIHDLIHLRFPRYFSWKVPPYYKLIVGPVARSSRMVITDAQATVADLHALLHVPLDRVRVVPLGATEAFALDEPERIVRAARAAQRFGLERPYFIYAGNHRPHKNIQTLVEAWRMTQGACDLVLTEEGPFGFELASGKKTNGRILALGRISQEDLINLYAGCAGAVQPSLYEGFGLGALEAMCAGAPVIVARTQALLELVGSASLTFGPHDGPELARHMDALLADPALAQRLRNAGRSRARDFSWERTAQLTAAVYHEALAC